ncbi:glutaconate CoA-transferase subunit B [Desulfotomaculum arcticum]|uniref:Glutaconate CoA-transferase subunit B n=1 Tax=Desulfotruncus arcticus DSM 17038 TaxID=1121424 RepID=A0A1I2XUQ4_9FIRM|nr:CoA-transferase [Desulfotruncus arcticus]SFH15851.1 glutaconate CoA-transferase subunit B [Desulfotomaculum arcticum] [Desulfotruncus arcticus DSM 17038]
MNYTTQEFMVSACSRLIKDNECVFIGVGIPLLAGVVASKIHATNSVLIYEAGGVGAVSRRLPWSISDNATTDNALVATELWRVLGDVQRGFIDVAVIGGAQIDKFGNLNTTVIMGPGNSYQKPKSRLPGSGGANDLASSAKRVLIIMKLEKRKFVEKLDYITSPGFITGREAREEFGLKGGGPEAVITNKCIFRFDPSSKEMYLDELFPGVTVEEVKSDVGWELKLAEDIKTVNPPTAKEIEIMHKIDPLGVVLGSKSAQGNQSFDEYYEIMKKCYESIALLL